MKLGIDRCMCFRRTFAEMAEVADRTGASSIVALQAHVPFGRKCGLCLPYVRRMLRTGQTVFDEVVSEADEPEGGVRQPERGTGRADRLGAPEAARG